MLISIDKNHKLFRSPEYLKDIAPFNLIEVLKHNPMLLISNEKNIILGMSAPIFPIWIWTADDIETSDIDELCEYFYDSFKDKQLLHYVAKPSIAKVLAKQFIKVKNATIEVVNMESFECPKLISAKNNTVIIERPSENDVFEIAECLSGFVMDCFGQIKSQEECIEWAKSYINNPMFFVIKEKEKVVSMACSTRETETHRAVNQVYTKPEYRGQGFASAIVAHICKLIFNSGKFPLLYTDLSNPSSNKAYKNIGFIERGKIDEITLNWSDNK